MDGVAGVGRRDVGRALVVDDLIEAREIVGDRLCEVGFAVGYAADGLDALNAFAREEPDLIVTDWQMPRLNGIGLVRRIREISDVPVVMLTAFGSIPDCEEAMRVGVDRYLQFRRDLHRVGAIALELIKDSAVKAEGVARASRIPATGVGRISNSAVIRMTAAEARSLAQQELGEELQKQLSACKGNISEMARRMGKDRSTIRYHLQRLGMLEPKTGEAIRLAPDQPKTNGEGERPPTRCRP